MKKFIIFLFCFLIFINLQVYSAQLSTSLIRIDPADDTRFTFGDNGENIGFSLSTSGTHFADNEPIDTDQPEVQGAFGSFIFVYYNLGGGRFLITADSSYTNEEDQGGETVEIILNWTGLTLKAESLDDGSDFWIAEVPEGENERLYIDPELGRFRIITSQDFDVSKLSVKFYYDIIPPANPSYSGLPDETIGDTPYFLNGIKEPYSSIWLSKNQGETEEIVIVDALDVWTYQIYFDPGNNILEIYAEDQMGNQSEIVESIPINYYAYVSKDVGIGDASKGRYTFGRREDTLVSEQIGHKLVKNDLGKTPLGLDTTTMQYDPALLQSDVVEAYQEDWLKIKLVELDIVAHYSLTLIYADLSIWPEGDDDIAFANQLAVDPINGRFLVGPGDAREDMKVDIGNIFPKHYYDPVEPGPPEIINVPDDLRVVVAECPFNVQGIKTPYSSVWFRWNEDGDFIQVSPVDNTPEWNHEIYLDNGDNFLEVYSTDYVGNESSIINYTLRYEIIKPTLEQDSLNKDECYGTLKGLKGKNSGIEYTTDLSLPYVPIIATNIDLTWDYQFSLVKGENNFYIRTVDMNGNYSAPVLGEITYTYQNPTLEVYSPTTSYTQWIYGTVGKKTSIENDVIITCDGITIKPPVELYDQYFACKLTGFVVGHAPYTVDIYTIDEAGNQSDTIHETIIFDPNSVGEENIRYEWANETLNISWEAPPVTPTASIYKVYLSKEQSEIDIDSVDARFSDTSLLDYERKLDSTYLTFHIQPDTTSEYITHKRINAKQLTTLVPFYEDFIRAAVLNQGTFFKINDWSVNETYDNLYNDNEADVSMIYIPRVSPAWSSYEYEVRLKRIPGALTGIDVSLLYKVQSDDNYYEFNVKDNQSTHIYNSQDIVDPTEEIISLDEYKKIKLIVKYHKPSGNTYVKSYIENGDGEMELKNYFVHPMFPYGGVGLKVKDCLVTVDYIKIIPLN